jgi:hypothetical protein
MKKFPYLFALHFLIVATAAMGWVVDPYWYSLTYLVVVIAEVWLISTSDIASLTRRGFLSQWTTFLWGGVVVVWLLAQADSLYFHQEWLSMFVGYLVAVPWQAILASVIAEFAELTISSKLVPRLASRTFDVERWSYPLTLQALLQGFFWIFFLIICIN